MSYTTNKFYSDMYRYVVICLVIRPNGQMLVLVLPPLVVQPTRRSSLGDRAFLVAAASLPPTVTDASTLHSFRRALKTHLFTASFPPY